MGTYSVLFDEHNKRSYGFVAGICKPEDSSKPTRYDIQVPIRGKKDKVLFYTSVNRRRVMRLQKYLACDEDWLAYAARTSGFETNEVRCIVEKSHHLKKTEMPSFHRCHHIFSHVQIPLRIKRMAEEIERMPDTSNLKKIVAYKPSGDAVTFPVVPASWRTLETSE